MESFIRTFSIVLSFCVFAQSTPTFTNSEIDSHLGQYSRYNTNHHDNIDSEPHSHTHKHSEDGEEHEHKHEHSNLVQSDKQFVGRDKNELKEVDLSESKRNFFEKSLISNPHPQGVFRPPIV